MSENAIDPHSKRVDETFLSSCRAPIDFTSRPMWREAQRQTMRRRLDVKTHGRRVKLARAHEMAWDQSSPVMLQKRLDAMRRTRWTADQHDTKHDSEITLIGWCSLTLVSAMTTCTHTRCQQM